MAGISPYPPTATVSGSTSSKSITGNSMMPADGFTDTFIIPHGMNAMPGYANVVAKNVTAIGDYSVSWNTTNITIMYSTAPTQGTLQLTWIAVP